MIAPEDAIVRLLALAEPVETETVALLEAVGRYLAAPVIARRTQPARDLSAMDGYAVRSGDWSGPWRVTGESAAGAPYDSSVGPNEAVRIFTGAAVPEGADAIIMQECAIRNGEDLILAADAFATDAAHIRAAGSDFATGQLLIDRGTQLAPARISLAAMGGHATVLVRRRLRVALISTGNELVPVGCETGIDRLPSSNAVMLSAILRGLPVDVTDFGIVGDDRAALTTAFERASDFDIIVSTGGASVGDHDLVQPALIDAGATMDFWKIAMRPGKPLMAGRLGKAVALGLPGNPVSAFVTASVFLKPLVAHLSGANDPRPQTMTARLAAAMPGVGIRTDYVRARWADGAVWPLPGDSGMLVPLASADMLIVRPSGSPAACAGDAVTIMPLT